MSLLFDTHVLLEILRSTLELRLSRHERHFIDRQVAVFASAASIWEIAIKVRLGKLGIGLPLDDLASYFEAIDIPIVPVNRYHAVVTALPEPPTRDPFDRLLLAVCKTEGFLLVTEDRALIDHPLAWKPGDD